MLTCIFHFKQRIRGHLTEKGENKIDVVLKTLEIKEIWTNNENETSIVGIKF